MKLPIKVQNNLHMANVFITFVFTYLLKGIVHPPPQKKATCLSAYPQGFQDAGDFIYSVEHKQRCLTQTVSHI